METRKSSLMVFNATLPNITSSFDRNHKITDNSKDQLVTNVIYTLIISSVELPLICLAVHVVYFLIKSGHAAPVFIINLLISDLLLIVSSLCIDVSLLLKWPLLNPALYIFFWAILTNLYFMTCIAVERYLLIVHSVWHRSHNSVNCLVYFSLAGWLVFLILLFLFRLVWRDFFLLLLYLVTVIAYIIIIFCFACACRNLSRSKAITSIKKQFWRVLMTLLFVLLCYTFLILPYNIGLMQYVIFHFMNERLIQIAEKLLMLTPFVDCFLYVFIRSDAPGYFKHCCPRLKTSQSSQR